MESREGTTGAKQVKRGTGWGNGSAMGVSMGAICMGGCEGCNSQGVEVRAWATQGDEGGYFCQDCWRSWSEEAEGGEGATQMRKWTRTTDSDRANKRP